MAKQPLLAVATAAALLAVVIAVPANTVAKVNVTEFYMATWPGCMEFSKYLYTHVFGAEGVKDIIEYNAHCLGRIPTSYEESGKATDEFPVCHHGGSIECVYQAEQLCAKEMGNEFDDFYLSHCHFQNLYASNLTTTCAEQSGFDPDMLARCGIEKGPDLLIKSFKIANAAGIHSAPTVFINGQQQVDTTKVLQAICKAYKGEKPKACQRADEVLKDYPPFEICEA